MSKKLFKFIETWESRIEMSCPSLDSDLLSWTQACISSLLGFRILPQVVSNVLGSSFWNFEPQYWFPVGKQPTVAFEASIIDRENAIKQELPWDISYDSEYLSILTENYCVQNEKKLKI